MKVIQINSLYNTGSTGKIVYDCHQYYLNHGINSIVIYGRGKTTLDHNVLRVCSELYSKANNLWSRLTGLMYGGLFLSTNRTIQFIKKEKPDVVHLQCINGYFVNIYRLVDFLKREKIKTILTLHAEFMFTANCGHSFECDKWRFGCGHCQNYKNITKSFFVDNTAKSWRKMKEAFDGFNDNIIVASVSPWLEERAKVSPILSSFRHVTVLNGIDTEVFHYSGSSLKDIIGVGPKQKIAFFVTPEFSLSPNHIKGGCFFFELARMHPEIKFLVAGPYSRDISIPENVIMLGMVKDQKRLALYYSTADITLILSRRETFSMICAESLCCGTPVAGFKAGAPELISLEEYSAWVDYGNLDGLSRQMQGILDSNFDKKKISEQAVSKYDRKVMASQYIDLYKSLLV